ncbi:MAG: 2'-deoxycytidine 5'-triphosphate deaminase [Pseudomonadota bacterium]
MRAGVLVDTQLKAFVAEGVIASEKPLDDGQIQPASMDVRLGAHAYRIQASVLPMRGETVEEAIKPLIMYDFSLSKQPRLLERGSIYMIKLQEGLKLPKGVSGIASPKSSTGRLDVFVRLLTDGGEVFDRVPDGYEGPLWLEVMPLTFPIKVRAGDRMLQLRLRSGETLVNDVALRALNAQTPLLHRRACDEGPTTIDEGLWISIDLQHGSGNGVIGYRAKAHTQPVDLGKIGQHNWQTFWEPIPLTADQPLILYPEEFYIFASLEQVTVPPGYSAELVAYDTRVGELRLHYAGFFDPGWGMVNGKSEGTRAVLEVRAHDVPCVLRHGQRLGRFVYETLSEAPEKLYGQEIGSNYSGQGLKLAKYFTMD